MSAEVENSKEEEAKEVERKNFKQKIQKNWQIGMKVLELLICAACTGFIYEPARLLKLGRDNLDHAGVMYTAYTGYILINVVLLIGRAVGDKIPYKTSAIFSINASALFFATAILLIVDREELVKNHAFHPNAYRVTLLTTSVCFAFVNVVVFFIDAFLTYKKRQDF